jgi:GT2 family glycosyltransferase
LLRDCLSSLVHQPQGLEVEVVVVDNASTDGAADMVAAEFPQVVLCRNASNQGFARANNRAAGLARGPFLFFLNNDTQVRPGTLVRLRDYALAHAHVGLIGPCLRDAAGRVQTSYRARPTVATFLHQTRLFRWTRLLRPRYQSYRRPGVPSASARRVEVLMGAALFLRREVFAEMGGWDEGYTFGGEDLDLCARIGGRYPIVYLPGVEVLHYGRASTKRHIGFAYCQIGRGFVRYLRKSGSSRGALLLYKAVLTIDAPLALAGRVLQYAWRRLNGRKEDAARSLLHCRGLTSFLMRGLPGLWRA